MTGQALVEHVAAADPDRAALLRAFPVDVIDVATPFYGRARVVDFAVHSSAGDLHFRYGLAGDAVVRLGGRPEAVLRLNALAGVTLEPTSVPAYLRFFFASIGERRLRIVENKDELAWRETGCGDAHSAVLATIAPVAVVPLAMGGYRAEAKAIWQTTLAELAVDVSAQGDVVMRGQRQLADALDLLPSTLLQA